MQRPLALALAAALTCAHDVPTQKIGSVPKQAPSTKAPKGEVLEWTSKEGKAYWYRIPKKARGKPALILMLHGTGLNHGWSFWNYPIVKGNFRKSDIVVSPDGLTPGGKTFNFAQGKKDGDHLVGIIKTFQSAFDIGKVYVYGHSQGAFFCYWFAGAHPELIDGIVAHAGNVLNVKHSKLAKEKVGIAILHGRADAVVSVACAERTHKIYKDQGYKKLKLYLVDGLTKRSGHWPLPMHVGEMLDWLDSVTANTAPSAIGAALSELTKKQPDFGTVKDCVRRGKKLLKKVKGDERAALEERAAAIQTLLTEAAGKHVDALQQNQANAKVDKYDSWVEHFRIANAVFAGRDEWDKPMKPLIARAKKDEKKVQKAMKTMSRRWNKTAFKAASDASMKSLLATAYPDLLANFIPRLERDIKGVKPVVRTGLAALLTTWQGLGKNGRKAANTINGELAKAFREKHPDWFDAL